MKFKGTCLFSLIVVAAVGFAVWDYNQQEKKADQKAAESFLIKDLVPGEITQLSFKRGDVEFILGNQEGSWKLISPVEDKLDYAEFDKFVTGVAEQDVKVLPVEGTIQWAQYGLDNPDTTIFIERKDKEAIKVEVGGVRSYNEGYYVRLNGEEKLYLGSSSWTSYLNKVANDFRTKDFYHGTIDHTGVQIRQGGKKMNFENREGKWVYTADPKIEVSQGSIDEYMNLVRHMKADAVVADKATPATRKLHNLNRPSLTVSVLEGEGKSKKKSITLEFGETKNNEVFVAVGSDRPVYRIQKTKLVELKKELSFFRDKTYPFAIDHTRIPGFRLKRSQDRKEHMFLRRSGQWILSVEEPHKKPSEEGISEFLNTLRGLKVKEFISGKGAKDQVKGQQAFIKLNAVGEILYELRWENTEKKKDTDNVKVWTTLSNEAFWVEAKALKELEAHEVLETDGSGATEEPAKAEANEKAAE